MTIVSKTLEEIQNELTPEIRKQMAKTLKNHIDAYDPENPPIIDFNPAELRRKDEAERMHSLIYMYKTNNPALTEAQKKEVEALLEYRRRRKLKRKMTEEAVPA